MLRPGGVALAAAALAALVACVLSLLLRRAPVSAPAEPGRAARFRSVALANRTISPAELAAAPASPGALSPRGTAAYALACAVPVTREIRELAASFGARVVGYLPRQALLVEASPSVVAAALGDSRFAGASAYLPSDKVRAGVTDGDVTVTPLAECDRDAVAEFVTASGGSVCMTGPSIRGSFGATVTAEALASLAERGDVLWIDRRTRPRAFNNYAVRDTGVTDAWDSLGLTGSGQVIATADTGIDTGNTTSLHADFGRRVIAIKNLGGCTTADYSGHGTHTAGTICGSGENSDGLFKGVAYEARLYVQACGTNVLGSGDICFAKARTYEDIFAGGISSGAYIHSDSWGDRVNGAYEEFCEGVDDVMWRRPNLLVVVAAGNYGSGSATVSAPGTAKNVLTVGNTYSSRSSSGPGAIYSSSSRGPCIDGRIKPDIVAPGVSIVSCRTSMYPGLSKFDSREEYTQMSGTSMATPHVAGCAALVRQWLQSRPGASGTPSGALIKAILTGGASEMTSNSSRMVQGFGRVSLSDALAPSGRSVKTHDRIPFSAGSCVKYSFTLTNAAPFEAQLVWTDYPATPSAGAAIVNDLDLVVVRMSTGETWYGNGVVGGDRTNTVEAVRIASAAPGEYRVMVVGESVAYDSTEGGAAALYVRGAFAADDGEEVTVPKRNVAVSVTGPSSLDLQGLSPAAGTVVVTDDFSSVSFSAPRFLPAVNANGTAVSRHELEECGVSGVGSWETADDGTNVVVTLVATNDVTVTWNYRTEADSYALYFLLSAQDSYRYRNYDCYIASNDGSLYNSVLLDGMWVERGSEVRVDLPGDDMSDEFRFSTLYYKIGTGMFSWTRTVSLGSPFVLKLGAVSLSEVDGQSAYEADSYGAMPTSLVFEMDGAKDIVGYYWDESRKVDGATIPYWWYMRNLYTAGGGGSAVVSGEGSAYTTDDGDPDGDGFGNIAEYGARTVPVDPLSFPFRVLSFSPTNIVWLGGKTATYTVETSDSLVRTAEWTELGPAVSAGGNVTNSAPISPLLPGNAHFFRIKAR